MRPQNEENRTKYLKVRMSATELVEVKLKAREAGFEDVSAFIRFVLRERQELDRYKTEVAKEAVDKFKRFGIGLPMLRAQGFEA